MEMVNSFKFKYPCGATMMVLSAGSLGVAYTGFHSIFMPWLLFLWCAGIWLSIKFIVTTKKFDLLKDVFSLMTLVHTTLWVVFFYGWAYDPVTTNIPQASIGPIEKIHIALGVLLLFMLSLFLLGFSKTLNNKTFATSLFLLANGIIFIIYCVLGL